MAYNPNFYNPAYFNQQGYPYQMQPMPQPTQQMQPQMDNAILWVNGEKDAAAFALAPNRAVALWDSTAPVIYLKQADASGRPSMKTFELVERNGGEAREPAREYATKEELLSVASTVKTFSESLTGIKSEIEKMSGDLYGIAGKKKAKKADSDEEG